MDLDADDSFSTFKNLDDSVEVSMMTKSTHMDSSKKILRLDDKQMSFNDSSISGISRGRYHRSDIKPEDMVDKKDQVLLEWKDVEFFVPIDELPKKKLDESEILFQSTIPAPEQDDNEYQKIEDEEINYLKHSESGLPVPQHILKGNNHFKQVLQKNSGYVKPNELVAIMGPSGSGKTSLLNVISQRSKLSKGSFIDGSIFLNGR
jgi:ABC-type glutathione transport system ATPase component